MFSLKRLLLATYFSIMLSSNYSNVFQIIRIRYFSSPKSSRAASASLRRRESSREGGYTIFFLLVIGYSLFLSFHHLIYLMTKLSTQLFSLNRLCDENRNAFHRTFYSVISSASEENYKIFERMYQRNTNFTFGHKCY